MSRRLSLDPLAPYEAARWANGSQGWDGLEEQHRFLPKQGPSLERWVEQGRPQEPEGYVGYVGRGPRGWLRSDERIRENVCEALERHGEIDASDLEVRCETGELTLLGWVEDRHQKRLAERVAESVAGVLEVHNRIRIRTHATAGRT